MTPVRIQLRRTKGWRMPADTVKVDRSTRWGNPFFVGQSVLSGEGMDFSESPLRTAEDAVASFRDMLAMEPRNYPIDLSPLRGRNLACWCNLDEPCHADVLLELVNGTIVR